MNAAPDVLSQRIDKWLWCSRIFKTRSLASKFVASGQIRILRHEESLRVEKASFLLKPGDQISFLRNERIYVFEVTALATRRGPAKEAQLLYEDHSSPPEPKEKSKPGMLVREKGMGRPTKKDRRAIDAILNKEI